MIIKLKDIAQSSNFLLWPPLYKTNSKRKRFVRIHTPVACEQALC